MTTESTSVSPNQTSPDRERQCVMLDITSRARDQMAVTVSFDMEERERSRAGRTGKGGDRWALWGGVNQASNR